MNQAPVRAFRLTLRIDADTRNDLVSALINFATQVDREEITTGVSGGVNSGWIYELLVDLNQTHEAYFQQLFEIACKRIEKAQQQQLIPLDGA